MMKEFEFRCLPSQLDAWVRQYHQLPADMQMGAGDAAELTFTALFPNVHYTKCRDGLVTHAFYDHGFGRRVETTLKAYPVGDAYVRIMTVKIADVGKGIKSALAMMESAGLLKGEEFIEKEMEVARAACKANIKVKPQRAKWFLPLIAVGILFMLAALVF